jgi:hypothetical protein
MVLQMQTSDPEPSVITTVQVIQARNGVLIPVFEMVCGRVRQIGTVIEPAQIERGKAA